MGILGTVFSFPPQPGIHIWQDDRKELAAAVLLVMSQGICNTTEREFLEPQTAFPGRE